MLEFMTQKKNYIMETRMLYRASSEPFTEDMSKRKQNKDQRDKKAIIQNSNYKLSMRIN